MIIGINGSPYAGHNTGFLVKKVLEAAQASGRQTRILNLGAMNIRPCIACMSCKKKGRQGACARKDDMRLFYDIAGRMTGLVIGTPIYFDQVAAQLKIFMDRLFCCLGPAMEISLPPNVKAGIVITYGDSNKTMYDYVIKWIAGRLAVYYKIKTVGSIKIGGCPEKLVVDKNAGLLKEARRLGERLAAE
jgi:multimeric flavodoxin WrbA